MLNTIQSGASTQWINSVGANAEKVRLSAQGETPKTEEKVDLALEDFRQKLVEGAGTGSSIQRLNLEKIEKIIEEKRQELLEKYGLNEGAKNAPQGDAYTTAMESMHKELSDFIKQLMEQLAIKDGIKKEPGGLVPRGSLISAVA